MLPPLPASVADLGCGTGTLSVLLAREGYAVTGVDVSSEMLRRAQDKAGDRSRFAQGDAADPPLAAHSFDVVLSRHVLWALPDPERVVARWARLLRPAGRLVLVEGRWHTGAGLTARRCEEIVHSCGRQAEVTRLTDTRLWGAPIADERYLLVSFR